MLASSTTPASRRYLLHPSHLPFVLSLSLSLSPPSHSLQLILCSFHHLPPHLAHTFAGLRTSPFLPFIFSPVHNLSSPLSFSPLSSLLSLFLSPLSLYIFYTT